MLVRNCRLPATAVIIAVRPWNSLEKNVIPGTPENISLLPPPVICF
jgi:hypothetical protein